MICAVIPTLNSAHTIAPLLEQLKPHIDRIVIADGGSSDDTLKIATGHGARLAVGTSGRGTQLKRGCDWSGECDWILVLHDDCRLSEGWFEAVKRHIKRKPQKAGYFDLRFQSDKITARIGEALVRLRCWAWGLPYGDQGLLISKKLYDEVGGYPDQPLFEDVAFIRQVGKRRICRLGLRIFTYGARHESDGYIRRGYKNFSLLRRYEKGDTIQNLMKDYYT